MQIPYSYLAVLLVFTLLIGVVIGDRLATPPPGGDDGLRSGGCSGVASARLHACIHRQGHVGPGKPGQPRTRHDVACDGDFDSGRDED